MCKDLESVCFAGREVIRGCRWRGFGEGEDWRWVLVGAAVLALILFVIWLACWLIVGRFTGFQQLFTAI